MSRRFVHAYDAATTYTVKTTKVVEELAFSSDEHIKAGAGEGVLPQDLSNHRFDACSFHEVDLSKANLNGTIFGEGTYLYKIDFSDQDLTNVTFDPKCKVRPYGRDHSSIQPFNLTNAKLAHEQLMLFIKHGVVDIKQINWDIQEQNIQKNKHNYIALCQVMYASSDHSASSPAGQFEFEAFRTSFRQLKGRHENRAQQLLDHCDPKKQTSSQRFTRIDLGASFPVGEVFSFSDIIYSLEQVRIRRDQSATPHGGVGERIATIQNITYQQRHLDDQHMPVEAFNRCHYNQSNLRNITYEAPTVSYNQCKFNGSTIAPRAINNGKTTHRMSFLRFNNCDFSQSTVIESTNTISTKLQFTNSRFNGAKLHGNFKGSSFSNPNQSSFSPQAEPCSFTDCELKGSFRSTSFAEAKLTDCHLNGDFANADFRGATLTNCDLSKMTFNKDNFIGATLKNCTVGGHSRIMYLMTVCQQDIRQLNWKKMGVDPAPYNALYALYEHSKMPKVKQAARFAHLICDASSHVMPLAGIEAALKAEGKKHHTRFVPDIFLRRVDRNRYFRASKEFEMPNTTAPRAS
ncbi:MAG: pentapeptide repeat-containing protein [Coxiellaceae bacterium]|nr:pentapeptide repeat-containing protein [Coxiellaceae bacterium]